MSSVTTCSAGSRRLRRLAVPVSASACSTSSAGICCANLSNAAGVKQATSPSASPSSDKVFSSMITAS